MNKKILVAAVPALDACLADLLAGQRLSFVRTLGGATRALEQDEFDLLVISVQFDDSRMFDLLRHARSEGRKKGLPILCLREAGPGVTSSSALEVACRALDADAFVDLANFRDEGERDATLRQVLDRLLAKRPPG